MKSLFCSGKPDWVKFGDDNLLIPDADSLTNLATCACCALRFEAEVLVGGGVCIEPADRIVEVSLRLGPN